MAGIATGNVFHIANVILLQQRRTQRILVRVTLAIDHHRLGAAGLLIAHVEHLIAWTQIILRRPVAAQAPLHLQGFSLVHQRHLIDWPMAGIAADSLGDMNAVIEKHKIGKLVYPRPLERLARAVAGAHRLKQLGVGPDLRMAVHAGLGGRNAREAGNLHRGVAVTAIDAQSGDVMLMAEGHWLRLAHASVSDVGRTLNLITDPTQSDHHKDRAENGYAR